jgi:hypothetical protein
MLARCAKAQPRYPVRICNGMCNRNMSFRPVASCGHRLGRGRVFFFAYGFDRCGARTGSTHILRPATGHPHALRAIRRFARLYIPGHRPMRQAAACVVAGGRISPLAPAAFNPVLQPGLFD